MPKITGLAATDKTHPEEQENKGRGSAFGLKKPQEESDPGFANGGLLMGRG